MVLVCRTSSFASASWCSTDRKCRLPVRQQWREYTHRGHQLPANPVKLGQFRLEAGRGTLEPVRHGIRPFQQPVGDVRCARRTARRCAQERLDLDVDLHARSRPRDALLARQASGRVLPIGQHLVVGDDRRTRRARRGSLKSVGDIQQRGTGCAGGVASQQRIGDFLEGASDHHRTGADAQRIQDIEPESMEQRAARILDDEQVRIGVFLRDEARASSAKRVGKALAAGSWLAANGSSQATPKKSRMRSLSSTIRSGSQ